MDVSFHYAKNEGYIEQLFQCYFKFKHDEFTFYGNNQL